MKAKKAPGPDGISSKVLSLIKSSAADGLFTVFHKSSSLNKFPDIWKQAKITPVYKKGSFSDVSNYRPISLLSIPCKLLENQICSIIDSHLQACNLLSEHQWGFRKGLSTEDLLLTMTEKWKLAMDKGQIVGAIFIDFQKAFDTVSHEILSLKLNAVGISGPLHQWLMNYLFDRYQYTEIYNKRSALLPIKFRVPQGSLLGPRLYTIYTNDLPNQVKDGLALMYADDTTLYTIGSSTDQVISSLNVMMSQISKWSSLNKLTIHPTKTEAMILAKQQFIGPLQPLHFGPGFVKLVNCTSCLGVTIDNKLSWHSQVDVVKASFSKKIDALRRMSYLRKLTLEKIYFKTIIPSITYGISVWGNCSQSLLNSLDHLHARACRIINRLPSQESSSCLLQCNWLPINYLYKRRILLKMHQIFVGAAPSQILDMCSISSRSTRFCNQFNLIRVKSELGRSSLQYRGPNIWNFINKKVKLGNVSKEGFKAILRKYSKDILNFSFNKEAIVISNKNDDFIYY